MIQTLSLGDKVFSLIGKTNFRMEKIKKYFTNKLLISATTAILLSFVFTSCGDDETTTNEGFDRSVLLNDIATNLIIPNFETLQTSVNSLATASDNFVQSSTEANLITMRNAWVQAVTDYQHCSAFGFGPGNLNLGSFSTVLGVFPVDETQVEQNITNPDFNLTATFDRDVRGFFTVEYLIYGMNQTDAEIVAAFDQERKDYLQLIVGELKTTFDAILAEWTTTYLAEFTSNDGTSAGSPISLLYNEFIKDYEILKNFKIELPAGLSAGVSADPSLVEAFYSGISTDLIQAHFESSKNIWFGQSKAGENFTGFEEYLETVIGGPELISTTKEAITGIDGAIEALPAGKLSDNLGNAQVATLRDLLQANTANFKSSMSSLLGISITFNSGDGD